MKMTFKGELQSCLHLLDVELKMRWGFRDMKKLSVMPKPLRPVLIEQEERESLFRTQASYK